MSVLSIYSVFDKLGEGIVLIFRILDIIIVISHVYDKRRRNEGRLSAANECGMGTDS